MEKKPRAMSLLTFEYDDLSDAGAVHESLLQRKIIHIDMDAFYASIEERDNPELRGHPVVVGGSPQSRGVVATCNYEARKFGIRSAMACAKAYKLCPKAIFVRPRFDKYVEASRMVKDILLRYSDKVEMLSLDEGFLDVTESAKESSATVIASAIKEEIFEATRLTCSAGIAPNKMLAKIATDQNKPNGITVLKPSQVKLFMRNLQLGKIPFVGPKSQARLKSRGWNTCGDIMDAGKSEVIAELGEWGFELWSRIHGLDFSSVSSFSKRKSMGEEHTYAKDLVDEDIILEKLKQISESLIQDVQKRNLSFRNITLKVKTAKFKIVSRSITTPQCFCDATELNRIAQILWEKANLKGVPIRLLGLSTAHFDEGVVPVVERLF